MAFKKTFLLSDESLNTYGFWVRTAGIRLAAATKNCPAYFNHRTWEIPLGHWVNLRVEDGKLLGDLVIEGANEIEKEYIRKIENGDIKGASVGLDPVEWNSDTLTLKDEQSKPALWESELFEASLAPLPGNKNALALKSKEGLLTLSDATQANLIPDLKTDNNMKQIALKLGLPENATEQQIIDAIAKVQLTAIDAEEMRKHIEQTANKQLATEDARSLFVELSKTNFKAALSFLNLNKTETVEAADEPEKPATTVKKDVKVSDLIQKGKVALSKAGEAADGKDSFDYLQKHNPVELARLRKEDNEKYVQLAKGYQNGIRYKA